MGDVTVSYFPHNLLGVQKMRYLIAVLAIAACSLSLQADIMPPAYEPYEVEIPGYRVEIRRNDDADPAVDSWTLSVLRVCKCLEHTGELVWSAPFTHTGYTSGQLSPDGQSFVVADPWEARLEIYRNGQAKLAFDAKALSFDWSAVELFCGMSAFESVEFLRCRCPEGHGHVQVVGVDGRVRDIDLQTGELVLL